jgi:hypothetical protein
MEITVKQLLALACMAVATALAAAAQSPPTLKPPNPGEEPGWNRMVRLDDGRTFVTDGAFALDATLARPNALPATVLGAASAKLVEGYLAAAFTTEFRLADLKASPSAKTYIAPNGIPLGAGYVDYLRRTLPAAQLRLRMKGELDPIVIVLDGNRVGVLMPVRR